MMLRGLMAAEPNPTHEVNMWDKRRVKKDGNV